MHEIVTWLRDLPTGWFVVLALAENAALVGITALLGHWALRLPGAHRVTPPPGPVSRLELALVAVATVLNAAVTVAGWWLWRAGIITFTLPLTWRALPDLVVLLLVMDVFLYLSHATVHVRWLFPLAHRLHHVFADPRPITLFALHPVEVAGFGGAWLAILAVHPFSAWAVAAYTLLNLLFGILGHLGVEPLPPRVRASAVFKWVATPAMHAGHHATPRYNLGFYTTVWDRLFGTLEPGYDARRTGAPPRTPVGDTTGIGIPTAPSAG
ncbi:sterol desaturase family protein [Dactylosporangium sp. NPDC049742]|uniref:sterol desaturase family protein n=1 Tax=Dactylosporangium sp. NPDC049742 TaxID=3154737 RepID=UPI00342E7B22